SLGGKRIKRVVAPRIVLTDEEFEQLIAYGLKQGEGLLSELYMLCLCARILGGMRTSDLHAWRWEHWDTQTWSSVLVPRPKTEGDEDELGDMVLTGPYTPPEELVAHVRSWWKRHGCPS